MLQVLGVAKFKIISVVLVSFQILGSCEVACTPRIAGKPGLNLIRFKRSKVCRNGLELCGNSCYNREDYNCHYATIGRRYFLCERNERVCGERCYDPSEYRCNGSGEDAVPCRRSEKSCGSKCYSSNTHSCEGGRVVPFYNSYSKATSNNQDYFSPWKSNDQLRPKQPYFSDGFFSSSYYSNESPDKVWSKGSNSGNTQYNTRNTSPFCPSNQEPCGSSCYRPESHRCFRQNSGSGYGSSTLICARGQERCGDQCYYPERELCRNENQQKANSGNSNFDSFGPRLDFEYGSRKEMLCPAGYASCGSSCYDPFGQAYRNCITGSQGKVQVIQPGTDNSEYSSFGQRNRCKPGEFKCGENCYDPQKFSCLQNANDGRTTKMRCESGKESCGNQCYDPFFDQCMDNGRGERIICRWNQKVCRGRCIDPYKETCSSQKY